MAAAAVLGALVAGLPWALARYVGWPLPDRVPAWSDVEGVLLAPMGTTLVVDVVACLTWLAWAAFVVDVIRCAIDVVRTARVPDASVAGPVRRIAAVLVGAVLLSVVSQRAVLAPSHNAPAPSAGAVRIGATQLASMNTATTGTAPNHAASARSTLARAPDPVTGVHDSLWRIAQRTLGDGNRWPEIWALNKGQPQPGGRAFTQPNLIFPGQVLELPPHARPAPRPAPAPRPTPAPKRPHTPSEQPPSTVTPSPRPDTPLTPPDREQSPSRSSAAAEPAVRWGDEVFVALGLASAVSTALVVARRRHRRRYRPGTGDRSDLPVAPVVYQLRLGHLRTERHDASDDPDDEPGGQRRRRPTEPVVGDSRDSTGSHTADYADRPESLTAIPVGVRDGHEVALELAASRGLGLVGDGATSAIRALTITAIATTGGRSGQARVLVTADVLDTLVGYRPSHSPDQNLPAVMRVVLDLDAALAELETEILVRARSTRSEPGWPPLLLVTRAPERQHPHARHRQWLQSVLDNGSAVGVIGVLLGQWTPGVTAHVRDDGLVSTTNPGLGEALRGTTVFRLGDDHTADLLDLLHRADPHTDRDAGPGVATRAEPPGALEILTAPATSPLAPEHRPTSHSLTPAPRTAPADAPIDDNAPQYRPLHITVLGAPRVFWHPAPTTTDTGGTGREITSRFQPRIRELLVFLALHPDGASREATIGALWPNSPPDKTTNVLNTTHTRLRRALADATDGTLADLVLAGDGRYRLDPALVDVDYHRLAEAIAARRTAGTDTDRLDANRRIVDNYTGPLADGLSTEWIETAREAIRRDAIDAVAALARALVDDDPQQTLDLLEVARVFDPHNEMIYRDIMRLQERLGQLDAIPRTLALLTTRLAEIDDRPTPQIIGLADALQHRHDSALDPPALDTADR